MTDIVSATGTYQWYYSSHSIPYQGNYAHVDPTSLTDMALATFDHYTIAQVNSILSQGLFPGGSPEVLQDSDVPGTSAPAPHVSGYGGGQLVANGPTYDTGTVQIYAYYWDTTYTNIVDSSTIHVKRVRLWVWIYYAPTSASPVISPIPTPVDATLDIALNNSGTYYPKPGEESILEKYRPGVLSIRAKFQTTRIAVIRGNNLGGFIIYEEIAGNPSGNCYVYNNDRTLHDIVQPSDLNQYII